MILGATAAKDSFHPDVSLVAGVFVNRSVNAPHRDADRPWAREHRRIRDGIAVVDRLAVDGRKPFDDREMIGRSAAAVLARLIDIRAEVAGLNDERISFPTTA